MVVLGGTLEEASGLGLGCMSVSGQYDNGVPLAEDEATAFFRGVYDAGCRHFDTAEAYRSAPELGVFNEAQLGKFFATVPRDTFTVGTKFHPGFHEDHDYATIKATVLEQLGRLGLEYIDLYYCHRTPSTHSEIGLPMHALRLVGKRLLKSSMSTEFAAEFAASCAKLRDEGLIKNIGLSECSAAALRAACAVAPICAVQQEWSLLTRNAEELLIPACKELGVGFVAYSPLARNLLAAAVKERPTDKRRESIPRFAEEHWEKNKLMGERLEDLAKQKGVTPAQLSMGWLLQKASDLGIATLPIPGTKTLSHALDNIASAQVKLSAEDMSLLEDIAKLSSGERESEKYMADAIEGRTASQAKM